MRCLERVNVDGKRRIERRIGRVFLIAALIFQQPATTAVIVVDGSCGLADAIASANTDSVVGGCTAGSGSDELRLTGDIGLTSVLPTVTSDISIAGGGFAVTRVLAAPDFRIFTVVGEPLTLKNMTVSNGVAERGGGISADAYATLIAENVTFTNNQATALGGALYLNDHSNLQLVDSIISGNDGGSGGGAVYTADFSDALIIDSTLVDNTATRGGAVYNGWDGTTQLIGSTLTLNSADDGGAISNGDFATITLRNSTVSGNTATDDAGGIYNAFGYGWVILIHSTVTGNTNSNLYTGFESGDIEVNNSIIAYPLGGTNCDGYTYFHGTGNFDDDGSCPSASPITAGIDFDVALAYNGGPTLTHALTPGSVAIDDAGDCGESIDQRGFARSDGACDAGAYEFGAAPLGGSVTGVDLREATCTNTTTADAVDAPLDDETWNCGAGGLLIAPGDRVRQSVRGQAVSGASGRVLGMTPAKLLCRNLSTGQSVQVALGASSWDCVAEGLVVTAGDRVQQTVTGQVP